MGVVIPGLTFLQLVLSILSLAFVLVGLPVEGTYPPLIGIKSPEQWKTHCFIGLSAIFMATSLVYFVASIRWDKQSMCGKTLINLVNFTCGVFLGISACVLIAEYVDWTNRAYNYCIILEDLCVSDMKSKMFLNYDLAMASGPVGLVASLLSVALTISAISRKEVYTRGYTGVRT